MRHLRRLAAVALLAASAAALPASAAAAPCVDDAGALTLTQQATWIHTGATKAGNLAAAGADSFPSWNTTKPTQSVQAGAGGGYAGAFAANLAGQDDATTGATFVGAFDGCLDTMLLELYAFLPTNRTGTSGSLAESPLNVYVGLTVDGKPLLTASPIETKTVPNAAGTATYRSRLALTGIHQALLDAGVDPAAKHTLRLNVMPQYANTSNAVFVYDTTEVPAGIVFNGTPDETYGELPLTSPEEETEEG